MKWHCLFLMVSLCWAACGSAQDVRRCIKADGTVVFTDGVCAEQEQEIAAPPPPAQTSQGVSQGMRPTIPLPPSCDRTPDDLLYGVRSAIDMQDVNQLAKHYHWPNVSDAQAEKLLDRLEKLVNSPLIDIQLLYPAEPEPEAYSFEQVETADATDSMEDDLSSLYQAASPRRAPYALKVSQYQSTVNTQTQTSTFHLQRYFDCWWIRY